jgi:hypothetical protein
MVMNLCSANTVSDTGTEELNTRQVSAYEVKGACDILRKTVPGYDNILDWRFKSCLCDVAGVVAHVN